MFSKMNLFNMAQREDKNLALSESVKLAKRKIDGELYRGFDLSTEDCPQLRLERVLDWFPFRERTEVTGWAIKLLNKTNGNSYLEINLCEKDGNRIASKKVSLGPQLVPITLPTSFTTPNRSQNHYLTLKLTGHERARAFMAVHKVLDRAELINLCQGKGVEIGPGTNPQVLPSKSVDVSYIEQSSPEDWNRLYNDTGKYPVNPKLWSRYQIGEARDLPASNDSLDFIFSSHVFEHLANPIGHLEYWYSKLTEGGIVLAIVPDLAGCKDYVFIPCPMSDFLAEYSIGHMEPSLEH
ncbi:MAG: class I SAM-dependent methyltransferase [Leptolyngbya sp. SIO3F4]|nr:class I SAM-dependent methyltransferase [Leptolyngbya sp. SIO3F4]